MSDVCVYASHNERTNLLGLDCQFMSSKEKAKIAQEEHNLDLSLVKDDEELTMFLKVLSESRAIGESISWYWEETQYHKDPSTGQLSYVNRFKTHPVANRFTFHGDAQAGEAEQGDAFVKCT